MIWRKEARAKRIERIAKNERRNAQNLAKAAGAGADTGARKRDIDRTLATTRTSTADLGKFDRVLDGEKKLCGVMRKVSVPSLHASSHITFTPVRSD